MNNIVGDFLTHSVQGATKKIPSLKIRFLSNASRLFHKILRTDPSVHDFVDFLSYRFIYREYAQRQT